MQPVAFFDLDHTVIRESTGHTAIRILHARGEVRARDVALGLWFGVLHYLDLANAEAIMRRVLIPYIGRTLDDVDREMAEHFAPSVLRNIYTEARSEIDARKKEGFRVVLLTASSAYMTRFVAEHLGVEYIGTQAKLVDGKFTGELDTPIPYGQGKVHHASQYVRLNQTDLAQAYFYSDSHSDLPLMNAVGNPVAVNPDFRLARVAKQAGWPIRRWQMLAHPSLQR